MRRSDVFVIAAWAATIFGLLEGVILVTLRAYPAILAPYKASAHLLWIAPLVDLPLFLLAAAGLYGLVRLTRERLRGRELSLAYSCFIFIGVFTVVEAPKLIHLVSVSLLALGMTVALGRRLRGVEQRLTAFLRRRLAWIPVLLVAAGLGVFGFERGLEIWRFSQLPPVRNRANDPPVGDALGAKRWQSAILRQDR